MLIIGNIRLENNEKLIKPECHILEYLGKLKQYPDALGTLDGKFQVLYVVVQDGCEKCYRLDANKPFKMYTERQDCSHMITHNSTSFVISTVTHHHTFCTNV